MKGRIGSRRAWLGIAVAALAARALALPAVSHAVPAPASDERGCSATERSSTTQRECVELAAAEVVRPGASAGPAGDVASNCSRYLAAAGFCAECTAPTGAVVACRSSPDRLPTGWIQQCSEVVPRCDCGYHDLLCDCVPGGPANSASFKPPVQWPGAGLSACMVPAAATPPVPRTEREAGGCTCRVAGAPVDGPRPMNLALGSMGSLAIVLAALRRSKPRPAR